MVPVSKCDSTSGNSDTSEDANENEGEDEEEEEEKEECKIGHFIVVSFIKCIPP